MFFATGFAQTDKIDSLKKVLPGLNDTARISCLADIGVQYSCQRKKDSSLHYIQLVQAESKQQNNIHGLALAYILKAIYAYNYYNDLIQTEQMAREAISCFHRTANKKKITFAYQVLGRALTDQSRYDEALTNLNLSLKWAQITGDHNFILMNLETMTDIYRDRGDYVKLLETQKKLAQIDRAQGDAGYYSFHESWVLGLMYRLLEEYKTALPFWRKIFVESP
ncbi:MAG TPA: hypothetical protein VFL47_16470, partial [Flavisolibacter sp.]|nr:hypothetical protein [Flavisolibacter sp.]